MSAMHYLFATSSTENFFCFLFFVFFLKNIIHSLLLQSVCLYFHRLCICYLCVLCVFRCVCVGGHMFLLKKVRFMLGSEGSKFHFP